MWTFLAALSTDPAFAGETMSWTTPLALVALDGDPLPAGTLDGKLTLFVNVASRCGYTPQYDGLQQLWSDYKARGLVVVGVPSNQFGAQEPGTAEEIQSFCRINYGVDFPLLAKQDVNGPGRSALYAKLIGTGPDIRWNFEKILVGKDGTVIGRFKSGVTPESAELRGAIDAALAAG